MLAQCDVHLAVTRACQEAFALGRGKSPLRQAAWLDKKRLDWWLEHKHEVQIHLFRPNDWEVWVGQTTVGRKIFKGRTARSALDEAMK
jgi:hypothetical protein